MATQTVNDAHASGMPQLDFSTYPNQIFWLAVTLVILYIILARIALPRISTVISDRRSTIQRDIDRAEMMKNQAKQAEASYQQALKLARAQAHNIIAQNKIEIQQDLDKAMNQADAEIAKHTEKSTQEIDAFQRQMAGQVEQIANATALEIVRTILPSTADKKTVRTAVTACLHQS